eukprot:2601363-Pyramimonas_sp.AAC.1
MAMPRHASAPAAAPRAAHCRGVPAGTTWRRPHAVSVAHWRGACEGGDASLAAGPALRGRSPPLLRLRPPSGSRLGPDGCARRAPPR